MYYVYILKLSNNQLYTGKTRDLRKRLKRHQNGECKTTKRIKPKDLVFYCAFGTEDLADKFETYLKSGSGIAFRNKHLITS